MKYLKRSLIIWIFLSCFLAEVESSDKLIKVSFLQPLVIPNMRGWSKEQWKREFTYMKDIGINEIIFQYVAFDNLILYDSELTDWFTPSSECISLDTVLEVCDSMDIDVYMGTWWYPSIFKGFYCVEETLTTYKERSIALVNEVWEKFGSHPCIKGWYLTSEVTYWFWESHCISDNVGKVARCWKEIADSCRALTPDKLVLTSPYFQLNYVKGNDTLHIDPDGFAVWIDSFACLSGVDVIAMQDGVGALDNLAAGYHVELDSVPIYYEIMKDVLDKYPDVHFWSHLELYDKTVPLWGDTINHATDIERVLKQITLESPYVEKIVCFEFNHWMSPTRLMETWDTLGLLLKSPQLYDDYKEHFWGIRNLAYNNSYELSPAPALQYPDSSGYELIDTIIPPPLSEHWNKYIGWQGADSIIIKFDFGGIDTVRDIRLYLLQDNSADIYLPIEVKVFISPDDTNYSFVGIAEGFRPDESKDVAVPFSWIDSACTGRWIKLVILSGGEWTFLSEVQVFGTSE